MQRGSIAIYAGDLKQAHADLSESRAFFLDAGEPMRVATADCRLGELATAERDYGTARAHFERSLAAFRSLGEQRGIFRQGLAIVLTHLGELADREGDDASASAYCQEALKLAQELGDKGTVAWTLVALGRIARHQGDEQRALPLVQEALLLRHEQGHTWASLVCLGEVAEAGVLAGQFERAVRLFAAAARHRTAAATPAANGDLSDYAPARTDQQLATLRTALAPAIFAKRWAEGTALSLEEAVDYALNR